VELCVPAAPQLARGDGLLAARHQGQGIVGQGHRHVGLEALFPDDPAGGREPLLGGHEDGRAVGQGELQQDGSGAKGCLAHHRGPLRVLQRPGHDLGRAGRPLVDEDREGEIEGGALSLHGNGLRLTRGIAHQQGIAGREELADGADGLAQQTPGVVAQVEDDPLQSLLLDGGQGFGQIVADPGTERRKSHEGHVGARNWLPGQALQGDAGPGDGHFPRLARVVVEEGKAHGGAGRPRHAGHHLFNVHAGHLLAVDGDDDVAGAQPRPLRRRAVDGCDNDHAAILHLHLDADAFQLAPYRVQVCP